MPKRQQRREHFTHFCVFFYLLDQLIKIRELILRLQDIVALSTAQCGLLPPHIYIDTVVRELKFLAIA